MTDRKAPQRTCVGCGMIKDKKDLIRIVHTPEDAYLLDVTGKKNGRGAYLCPDAACLAKAVKCRSLNRSFGTQVPDEAIESLKKEMEALVVQ